MKEHCSHVRQPQFGVGFRGAGAPMRLGFSAADGRGIDLPPVFSWRGEELSENLAKSIDEFYG